jgi:hypothetical protein
MPARATPRPADLRTVGDYLRIPYLVTAESQPLPDGGGSKS